MVKSATGIINKPINASYLSSIPSGPTNFMHDKETGQEGGYSIEYWEDMQCRLQYMQAQVSFYNNTMLWNFRRNMN